MTQDSWIRIRALRSDPPLLAREPERRRTFAAALAQSEELFVAAAAVSPASRPLPLFYGLSQAGRAISAAQNDGPEWRIRGHGLSARHDGEDVRRSIVVPKPSKTGNDAVSAVVASLGSAPFSGPVSVGQLWAALPELRFSQHMPAGHTPALQVRPEGANLNLLSALHPARCSFAAEVGSSEELATLLSHYAGTDGWELLSEFSPSVRGWTHVTVSWPPSGAARTPLGAVRMRNLNEIAEFVDGAWFLRPVFGAGDPTTTPTAPQRLLVWWLLLFALSSLARYEPETWTAALEVDSSTLAVELEQGLQMAEAVVPGLIRDALGRSGHPPNVYMRQALAEELAASDPAEDS